MDPFEFLNTPNQSFNFNSQSSSDSFVETIPKEEEIMAEILANRQKDEVVNEKKRKLVFNSLGRGKLVASTSHVADFENKAVKKFVKPNFALSATTTSKEEEEKLADLPSPPAKYADNCSSEKCSECENKNYFYDSCFGLVSIIEKVEKHFDPSQQNDKNKSFSFDESAKSLHEKLQTNWPNSKYFDTHCHLDLISHRYNVTTNLTELRRRYDDTWSPNFAGCISDFCFPKTFTVNELWDPILSNDNVWAAVGCHPRHAKSYDDDVEQFIVNKLSHPKVVAVGELGLDYAYAGNAADREVQKKVLEAQLRMATKSGRPLLLHCRDAEEDCFAIFKTFVKHDYPIHWHCCCASWSVAEKWHNYFTNMYFGVTPSVCCGNGVVEQFCYDAPLHRLLIETDSPYFLPPQYRSKTFGSMEFCHPGMGALVAIKIAEIKNETVTDVFQEMFQNTINLYKIQQ